MRDFPAAAPLVLLALACLPASCGGQASDTASESDELAKTSIAQLLAMTDRCDAASEGRFATDQDGPATIDICRLKGAFFWKADMDVDCDGQETSECNLTTDPDFQNETSFTQSNDEPLVASRLPYIVIPQQSARFDYEKAGIEPGAVAVVIYRGQIGYGVFGDEGPPTIVGESSYAMAKSLGINPDPSNGGVDDGVTYLVFTGVDAVVDPLESHAAAVAKGKSLVRKLVQYR